MRYLLFFFFLVLHSYVVFADDGPMLPTGCTAGPWGQGCSSNPSYAACPSPYFIRILTCSSPAGDPKSYTSASCMANCKCQPTFELRDGRCRCPVGQVSYNTSVDGSTKTCGPASCPQGQQINIVNGLASCIDIPDNNPGGEEPNSCEESEKVYDPISGTMVCPGSGDGGSSSSSSQACVVPGDFDGDCVPDDEQASSAADSSTPTSSPDSGSSGSAASTGGGDDGGGGNNNGGGGGDDGSGGNNNGGGSASSTASTGSNSSWTPNAGYGNWIPVSADSTCPNKYKDQSGQWWCSGGNSGDFGSAGSASSFSGACNPTSKNYFSCITSEKLDGTPNGSSSSWTPASGYGNWIPVGEDSNCPNKYKDASGNWWCSGGTGASGGGAGGSSGSAASAAVASSAAGKCDPTSENYLACISKPASSSGSNSSASSSVNSSASSSRSGAFSSLGDKGEFDGEASEKKHDELVQELEDKIADIQNDIQAQVGGTISGTGGIQDFCKNIRSAEVCFGLQKYEDYLEPISAAIFLVACVVSFAIVLRG